MKWSRLAFFFPYIPIMISIWILYHATASMNLSFSTLEVDSPKQEAGSIKKYVPQACTNEGYEVAQKWAAANDYILGPMAIEHSDEPCWYFRPKTAIEKIQERKT